jgi:HemK-related putative methylase
MSVSEFSVQLLGNPKQGVLRESLGRLLGFANRISGRYKYDARRMEIVRGFPLVILPSVFNPRVLRTGEFFAAVIEDRRLGEGQRVLDMGTGSGVCAVSLARHARHVVAVDINRAAVRCAAINAMLNEVDTRVECRHGDLFAPLADERFDAIFFNPPFIVGTPVNERDCAWRSTDVASRFAAGLDRHLTDNGRVYLLLSTFGDACGSFVDELQRAGFRMKVLAVQRFINERVTIVEACR